MKKFSESGLSSTDTHRLTQRSNTLNRRYVSRPSNLAIEEAALMADYRERNAADVKTGPSRLVNMQVHDEDLMAARAEITAEQSKSPTEEIPKPKNNIVKPKVIELGTPATKSSEEPTTKKESDKPAITEAPEPTITKMLPTSSQSSAQPVSTESEAESKSPEEKVAEALTVEPSMLPVKNADLDTRELAMNIAADYTAATLGATMANLPDRIEEVDEDLSTAVAEAHIADSIDEIAQTVSNYIAKVRNASTAEEISEHISALKEYTADIKTRCNTPEVTELAGTIEKFIAVTEKSTGIKNSKASDQKITLTPKAHRAADKVDKSTIKVTAKPAAKPNKIIAFNRPKLTKTSSSAPQQVKYSAKPAKSIPNLGKKSSNPSSNRRLNDDATLRKAMHSVAKMNESSSKAPHAKPVRREGRFKRFALAFGCATLAIAGIAYFVASNIPDISVRVAAMQAGVDSAYPSYVPSGFSLDKIESEDNQIILTFKNPEGKSFTLIEKKSSWDSTTLERNFAKPSWGKDYSTTHEQGITIFIHESSAAWVNGGVMSKIIAENGVLTTKQLRSIVTSMQ